MKKSMSVVLALCLILGACLFAGAEQKTYKIGILQQLQHVALDAASQGFMDALTERLGDRVSFYGGEPQNASNVQDNCVTIAGLFVDNKVDLIMANATTALQSCVNATETIPVLGTSITNYETALDIDLTESGATGLNVSGTSDLAPLAQQAQMVRDLFPDTKTVALLYCTAEPNSVFQIREVAKCLADLGISTEDCGFTDSNDIASVTEKATGCDVIYIPTDNTAAENTEAIYNIVVPAKVPVIAGEEGICAGCGVATLSISYYDIGYETGVMAYEILENGADIADMPIRYAPKFTLEYNSEICAELGVTVPDNYVAIGE